jgi:hypothetical protein
LAVAALYLTGMLGVGAAARADVIEAWVAVAGAPPRALMVGPRPVTPFEREVIVDAGDRYHTGSVTWPWGRVWFDEAVVPKGEWLPGVAAARGAPGVRGFLVWSRFPYWTLDDTGGRPTVTVRDMRFGAARGDLFSARPE